MYVECKDGYNSARMPSHIALQCADASRRVRRGDETRRFRFRVRVTIRDGLACGKARNGDAPEKCTPRSRTAAVRQRRAHVRPRCSQSATWRGMAGRSGKGYGGQSRKGTQGGAGRERKARMGGHNIRQGRLRSNVPESYRIALELRMEPSAAACSFLEASPPERIFQNRSVSSAAAVTTVVPSGD